MTTPSSTLDSRLICAQCPAPKPAAWCRGCPRETTCHFVYGRIQQGADFVIVSESAVKPKISNVLSIHTPYADDESLTVVFGGGRTRRPAEVSFLLDRLRNETITRVRVIFAPELRDAMRAALIR